MSRKRKVLGEVDLPGSRIRPGRDSLKKRVVSEQDPYGWIEGKEGGKRVERKSSVRKGKSGKIKKARTSASPKIDKMARLSAIIRNKLSKAEKGAVLLPQEIMAAAEHTGKFTGKIAADVSRTIASTAVLGKKEAVRVIRHLQAKYKTAPLNREINRLLVSLGKEANQLLAKKKDILKDRRVQNLLGRIKKYQQELTRIKKEYLL